MRPLWIFRTSIKFPKFISEVSFVASKFPSLAFFLVPFIFDPPAMSSNNRNFSRPLNCRERRRLKVLQMLPVDIIDPSSSVQDLIEKFQVKQLYRYGSGLDETIIEIESNSADAKGKKFSQLRGLHRHHHAKPLILIYRIFLRFRAA